LNFRIRVIVQLIVLSYVNQMNIENECVIFYDKYAGESHGFKNPLTRNIVMKDLFSSYEYIEGHDAIIRYNTKFGGNMVIPETLDISMMNIYMFQYIGQSNVEYVITVLSIDTKKVRQYYEQHKTIPNREFVTNACIFHTNYEKQFTQNLTKYDQVNAITQKVIIPSSDIVDPMIDNPKYMKYQLYEYQRRSIKGMLDTENRSDKVYYSFNHNYEINIGNLIFDPITKKLFDRNEQNYLEFKGGALIDEVGLGKTIQILNLIMMNRSSDLSLINSNPHMLRSRATLIICPNQLCNQWAREIKKMISVDNLKVVLVLTKIHYDAITYYDLMNADIVIMSYNFINNQCFTEQITTRLGSVAKNYCASKAFKYQDVKEVIDKIRNECVSDQTILFKKNVIFPSIYWHRIVVDEFHEVSTVNKYLVVKNMVPFFQSDYRWTVSGTPFDRGNTCFYGMLDFATNYQNHLGEDIIQMDSVNKYMMNNFFRRNTKKSVEDEFKLPELKEKIIWLRFTHTERMMYNAYRTDPNVSKFSEILRQICCHPKIAEEIKGVLDKCQTLDDIQNKMVKHYETQYKQAEKQVNKCKLYCLKTERRILIVNYKRQRKFLKQIGYRVKIELPPTNYPEVEIDDDELDDVDNKEADIKDDSDDDDGPDDLDKPLIVICEEKQTQILKLVGKKLNANPSQTIVNMNDILVQQTKRLEGAVNICKGKKGSFDFFNNMLERIKKTTDLAKKKYDRELKKNKMRDDGKETDDSEDSDESDDEDDLDTCGICLNTISGDDMGVTNCGHIYCYECLKVTVRDLRKCPMCCKSLQQSDISMISYEKPVYTPQNSHIIRNKLELINKVGTKLTNLIYYLNSIDDHVIIFSQWDSLLRKVGDVLNDHGIRNVFCRGNVWTRDRAIREFMGGDDIRVIMLSSESAASGTNLTKATKVILLDPVSGEYEYRRNMEWQAIGRAYRMGQTNRVEVVRFIIKDTVEEDIYQMNKAEDVKHLTINKISETTDETILLSDDKLSAISEAVIRSKQNTDLRNKLILEKKTNANKKNGKEKKDCIKGRDKVVAKKANNL